VEVGVFVLVMYENAPTRLELGEVVAVDDLREHATTRTWGSFSGKLTAKHMPCWVDPRDGKWTYTHKPLARYLPSTRQVFDEHIRSYAFKLLKGGKLPKAIRETNWDVVLPTDD
jgi:hypothetical protein